MKKNILIFCISILFVECFFSFYLTKASDPILRVRKILKIDSHLGWFQKPNLATTFENAILNTDDSGFRKQDSGINSARTVILGPSSAFGWGVSDNETYSNIIQNNKKTSWGETVNFSGIGHTIYQGHLIYQKFDLEKIENIKNIIFAYGINELDNYRFFDFENTPDKDYFSKKIDLHFLIDFSQKFSLGLVFNRIFEEYSFNKNCHYPMILNTRVDFNEYQDLITQFSKKTNKNIYLLTTLFYLDPDKYPENKIEESILKQKQLYELAHKFMTENNCKSAYQNYSEARKLEPYRIKKAVDTFNENLSTLNNNKIKVIDIRSGFLKQFSEKMYDPVHPNKIGHYEIANVILNYK